jgi:hypothetical protein
MDEARRLKTDGSKTDQWEKTDGSPLGKTEKWMDEARRLENGWIQNGSMAKRMDPFGEKNGWMKPEG